MRRFALWMAAALSLLSVQHALAVDRVDWTTVEAGGSTVDLPTLLVVGHSTDLLVDGVVHGSAYRSLNGTFSLSQYWATSQKRPFLYLSGLFGNNEYLVTYHYDKATMGVMSGFVGQHQTDIFYAVCRKGTRALACLTMQYPAELKRRLDGVVTRIVKSFSVS